MHVHYDAVMAEVSINDKLPIIVRLGAGQSVCVCEGE